jgi:hypothetical protein
MGSGYLWRVLADAAESCSAPKPGERWERRGERHAAGRVSVEVSEDE